MRLANPGDAVGKWTYRCGRALVGLRDYDRAREIFDKALACPDVDARLRADILRCKKAIAAAEQAKPRVSDAAIRDESVRVENFHRACEGEETPKPLAGWTAAQRGEYLKHV